MPVTVVILKPKVSTQGLSEIRNIYLDLFQTNSVHRSMPQLMSQIFFSI